MKDELAARRRRNVIDTLRVGFRVDYRPCLVSVWFGGPWWFIAMVSLAILGIGVVLASTTLIVVDWVARGDWRAIALALMWAAMALARVVRDARSQKDDEDDESGGAA